MNAEKIAIIGEQAWHELRKTGIGGSDAAAVVGLSRYRSPVQVYLEKTEQVEAPDLSDNEKVYWGTVLEDVVAQEFTKRTGKKARRVNQVLRHKEHPFMLANVDRMVVGEDAGLECKTAGAWAKDQWGEETLPQEYVIQCLHYMAVTGATRWYLAVLIGGQEFRHFTIERDEETIKYLIDAENNFWDKVQRGEMPDPDGSDSATDAIKDMYPESNGESIDLPSDALTLIAVYQQAHANQKQAEGDKKEAANRLQMMLGDYEIGNIAGNIVKWKSSTRTSLDTKALKKAHPNIYKAFEKTTSSRRFSITGG